jgi:hypothetical protein
MKGEMVKTIGYFFFSLGSCLHEPLPWSVSSQIT